MQKRQQMIKEHLRIRQQNAGGMDTGNTGMFPQPGYKPGPQDGQPMHHMQPGQTPVCEFC